MSETTTATDPRYYLVFDVESMGLHGDGFAAGWCVLDTNDGEISDAGYAACSDGMAKQGASGDAEWVAENVVPTLPAPTHSRPRDVRGAFWTVWQEWKARGALLAADVAWPVEARFLLDCIDDFRDDRAWGGPYPLVDIASVRYALGWDPLATEPRTPNELPAHNPTNDARQSARLLYEALHGSPK